MKLAPVPTEVEAEKLRPILHLKIEQMDTSQLALLNSLLTQLEVEDMAERLGKAFDEDQDQGKLQSIPELVKQFRAQHRYS